MPSLSAVMTMEGEPGQGPEVRRETDDTGYTDHIVYAERGNPEGRPTHHEREPTNHERGRAGRLRQT
ncbi:hypothetical protein GCM10022232_14460 [Streptomyces plumbiresistens]|uniref:Uncharacterized protein n=1 Tax=Streptomyces plumbiresistens TaxID=511811 RepID=A0ABP7QIQ8_9ACTN